jgi:hypothetical protein
MPTFTQQQIDALAAQYAKGIVSGTYIIDGRQYSFNYGSLASMWEVISTMQQQIEAASNSGARRSVTSFSRGY